jgi:SAM-dependent methyltransferase
MKTIDIGCGVKKYPGAIGIDAHKMPEVDIVLDLENGKLPFETSSVDSAFSSHTLEHITNLQKLIEEVHRVLKNKGIFTIRVPYFNSSGAYALGHKHFFKYDSFDLFTGNHPMAQYRTTVKFNYRSRKIVFGKKFALWNYLLELIFNLIPKIYENSILRIFPADELLVELECVK